MRQSATSSLDATKAKQKRRTLTELLVLLLLREPLERRYDQHHDLLPDLRAPLGILVQDLRKPMPFNDLVEQFEELGELLLRRGLVRLVPRVVRDRLHQRREVQVEVPGLGRAVRRVQRLRGLRGEEGEDGVAFGLHEEVLAEVGDVVQEEDRVEGRPPLRSREGGETVDGGRDDVVWMMLEERRDGEGENVRIKCSVMVLSSSAPSLLPLPTCTPSPIFQFPSPRAYSADSTAL
jgi:hypothetical protein